MSGPEKSQNSAPGNGKDYAGLFAATFFLVCVGVYVGLVVGWIVFPKLLYATKEQPLDFNHQVHVELVDDSCRSCHDFREDGTFAGVPKLENCAQCHVFDHSYHEEAADCLDCHAEDEDGEVIEDEFVLEGGKIDYACGQCHGDTRGEDKDEIALRQAYINLDKEIPWLIYAKQPACVFFSHAAHVFSDEYDELSEGETFPALGEGEGAKCYTCHGGIGESTNLKPYQENRITGYSRDIWGQNLMGLREHWWDRMKMDDCADCHKKKKLHLKSAQAKEACFVCHK